MNTPKLDTRDLDISIEFALAHLEALPEAQIILTLAIPDGDELLVRTAISVNRPNWLRSILAHLNDQANVVLADQCKNDEEEDEPADA